MLSKKELSKLKDEDLIKVPATKKNITKTKKNSITIYSPPLLDYLKEKLLKMKISFYTIHNDIVLTNKKDFAIVNDMIEKMITWKK